jgi:hypothetical protein
MLDPSEVDKKIFEYYMSKKEISKLEIDEKNSRFFQVRTK